MNEHTGTMVTFLILLVMVGLRLLTRSGRAILRGFLGSQTSVRPPRRTGVNRGGLQSSSVLHGTTTALLPESVVSRIARDRQQHGAWTSSLSVNEWLLLKSLKLRPVGLVTGFSHFRLAMSLEDHMRFISSSPRYASGVSVLQSYLDTDFSHEISDYSDVLRATCQKALDRLLEEARLHGAHAVVGVTLVPRWPDRIGRQVEYMATGTAVVMEGHEPTQDPILCTTSVIEFAKLVEAGTMPMGIALGLGIYFKSSSFGAQWKSSSWCNKEITEFSNAKYSARNIALQQMRDDAVSAGGAGVLGYDTKMQVHRLEVEHGHGSSDSRTDHVIEYKCLGTVVGAVATGAPKIKTIIELVR